MFNIVSFLDYRTIFVILFSAVVGAILNQFVRYFLEWKRRKEKISEAIQSIANNMAQSDQKHAMQLLAESIPQFKDDERIVILMLVGSLNISHSDKMIKYILEELSAYCEGLGNVKEIGDVFEVREKRILLILDALSNIAMQNYRQSRNLNKCFNLFRQLDKYSIFKKYEKAIIFSIETYSLFKDEEWATKNLRKKSIEQLASLKKSLRHSSYTERKIFQLLKRADKAIVKEREYVNSLVFIPPRSD